MKIKTLKINLWDKHTEGHYIIITTNGVINSHGHAVMGKGIAKAAANKYPHLSMKLGSEIDKRGNKVFIWPEYKLITFPTKDNWRDNSKISLIKSGVDQLYKAFISGECGSTNIYSPILGCGLGNLKWEDVAEAIHPQFMKFHGGLIFCEL